MRSFRAHRSRRGVALIYAVFGAFVAGSMVAVMLTAASVTRTKADLKAEKLQARYLAEGALESAKKTIQGALANWKQPPETGSVTISGTPVDYTVKAVGDEETVTDPAGIQTLIQAFELQAQAKVGDAQVVAHKIVRAESTPIFQFVVFYNGDLEVQPGPDMTLSGRVHSNSSMYLGCGGTLRLNTNYVRCVGDMYRRRKDNTTSTGTVEIRKYVVNPFAEGSPVYERMESQSQMSAEGVATESGYDSNFTDGYDANGDGDFDDPDDYLPFGPGALERWGPVDGYPEEGNTVLTGEHGMTESSTPGSNSIAMYEPYEGGDYVLNSSTGLYDYVGAGNGNYSKGYYHKNAGLSIVVNKGGTSFTAYDADGHDVTAAIASAVTLASVYDSRQGGSVKVAKVNLGALASTGHYPANGLLYCSHYGMAAGRGAKGVQLVNGSELYTSDASGHHNPAPLTVVSEGSLYIQGNYNTTQKVGAAVIADAVNLLSNAWNGSKTSSSLPAASDTTYNVAMITGNHETLGSSYNGGLENLPRFHENWSNKRAAILGSFVNTWSSQYATGQWVYGGNRYTAPLRLWSYDTAFNRVSNLPPFTPMVVTSEDVVSW